MSVILFVCFFFFALRPKENIFVFAKCGLGVEKNGEWKLESC